MPEPRIRRRYRTFDVTIGTNAAASTAIRYDDIAGGSLQIGTQVTATQFVTTLQVWAAPAVDGSFARLHDPSGSAANIVLTRDSSNATSYQMPDATFSVGALKLIAESTHLTSATVHLKT